MIRYILPAAMLVTAVVAAHAVKEYRKDYEYNPKTHAFYKLHTESVSFWNAVRQCEAEDAKLIMTVPGDIKLVHAMLKKFPNVSDFVWANDGLPHEFGDIGEYDFEASWNDTREVVDNVCEAVTREGEVLKFECFERFPFVCKVEEKDIIYNPQCNMYTRGYQYLENVGSCYKISSTAVSWNEAYEECQREGAHLLVLNSELEHQAVYNLTLAAPNVSNGITKWFLAGIRANQTEDKSPLVFKTIFDETLKEAGFDQWSEGEPNHWRNIEFCGSISRSDGKYNDVPCDFVFAYICEKEVKTKI